MFLRVVILGLKIKYILLIVLVCFPCRGNYIFGQEAFPVYDTTLASKLFLQADSLQFSGENTAALLLYSRASKKYRIAGEAQRSWMAFHAQLELLIRLRDPRAASMVDSLEAELPDLKRTYPVQDAILMYSIRNLGYYYSSRQEFQKSVLLFEQLFQTGDSLGFPSHRFFVQAATRFSRPLIYTDQFRKAFLLMAEAEKIMDTEEMMCHCEDLGKTVYTAIASIYAMRRYYADAKIYYERALQEVRKRDNLDESQNAGLFVNLAGVTKELYELEKSKQYGEEALRLVAQQYGKDHIYMAYAYNNLGNTLKYLKEYKASESCQLKSLAIREQIFDPSHISLADPLQNMGSLYLEMKQYEDAISFSRQAETLFIKHYGPQHSALVSIYLLASYAKEELGDISASLAYADQAIQIVQSNQEISKRDYARALKQKAQLLQRMGQLEASLKYYQLALIQNHDSFDNTDWYVNPPWRGSENIHKVHTYQTGKGRSLFLLYQQNKNPDVLKLSGDCFQLASRAIDSLCATTQVETDLLELGNKAHVMFLWGIETEVQLYEFSGDRKHLERAFEYAEKSRATTLKKALQAENTKISAGVDPHLIEKEEKFLADLAYAQEQVRYWAEIGDSLKVVANKANVFMYTTRYDSLLAYYKKALPAYYALRFHSQYPDLTKTQQSLPENTTLVMYAEGENDLFVFTISSKKAEVIRQNWNIEQKTFLQDFLFQLKNPVRALQTENDPSAISTFEADAHQLYLELLAPLKLDRNSSLWIVPDGLLSYLPFEVLVKQKQETAPTSFRELAYLFRQQNLRYAFSAGLALEQKDYQEQELAYTYIGFAPQYESSETIFANLRGMDEEILIRDSWTNLRSNQPEVAQAAELWRGEAFSGPAATETLFKNISAEYDIIHLAMHAFTNDQKPAYSGLIFASGVDSSDDQILYAHEIGNLKLRAELVVLSACNTGTGSQIRGEGVMSLARAFRYAGCRNLLTSLWQTEDQAAAHLVGDFFIHLDQELPKAEALRQARFAYLESGRHAHPYFWAPFVLIGDDIPIRKSAHFPLLLLVTISFFLALSVIFLKKRKKR